MVMLGRRTGKILRSGNKQEIWKKWFRAWVALTTGVSAVLSWLTSMPINQNQDKVCSRDRVSVSVGVLKITMIMIMNTMITIPWTREQDIWDKAEFSLGPNPYYFTSSNFSSSSASTQEMAQQDLHVCRHSERCMRSSTHTEAPMHPHFWQGWSFPLKWQCSEDVSSRRTLLPSSVHHRCCRKKCAGIILPSSP